MPQLSRTRFHTAASWLVLGAMALLLCLSALRSGPAFAAPSGTNLLVNGGFEDDGTGTGDPIGWSSTGDVGADFTEFGGRSSDYRLSHWASGAYTVETSQTITGLTNGPHTLRVWAKSGGGQNELSIGLQNCGGADTQTPIPQTSDTAWEQFEVSTNVTNGQCTISLYSDANAGNWANFDDVQFVNDAAPTPTSTMTMTPAPTPTRADPLQIRGADISSLDKSEALGGLYSDTNGVEDDALAILSRAGMNYIRLRVWVDPADGYHTKERILPIVQRAKDLGMGVLIDFHYSDTWADPGKQFKPAAWENYTFEELKTAVYDHTRDLCDALVAQGTPPDIIQVGNEIKDGMLWPDGRLAENNYEFDKLAELLKEGVRAVEECSSSTRVMLHLPEGGNYGLLDWWYGEIIAQGVDFDIIGVSYYPFWHGTLDQLQSSINQISAKYDKDVVVVEFSYPFTLEDDDNYANVISQESELTEGYPATPDGQLAMTRSIMNVVSQVPDGRGLGVFYWDATWIAVPGNGWDPADPSTGDAWENQALFDFNGQALPALGEFAGASPTATELSSLSQTSGSRAPLFSILLMAGVLLLALVRHKRL